MNALMQYLSSALTPDQLNRMFSPALLAPHLAATTTPDRYRLPIEADLATQARMAAPWDHRRDREGTTWNAWTGARGQEPDVQNLLARQQVQMIMQTLKRSGQ
jgi:hypothetical protein